MPVTDELKKKVHNLSTDLEIGLYSPSSTYLTTEEANFLYEHKDSHNIPDHILYFYLSDEDKLKYIDDVKYFWDFDAKTFLLTKDTHTARKIYGKLLENESFVSAKVYEDLFNHIHDANFAYPLLKELIENKNITEDVLMTVYNQLYFYSNDDMIADLSITFLNNRDNFEMKRFFWMIERIKNADIFRNVINEVLKKDDNFLKEAIELNCIEDCIKRLPSNIKKDVIFKLAKIPNVNGEMLMSLIANLDFSEIREYLETESVSIDNIKILSEKIYSHKWNDSDSSDVKRLYYYLDSLIDKGKNYITFDYIETLSRVFPYKELLEIVKKHVLSNKEATALEKCQLLYQLFDEEELLGAIDFAIPILKEEIHPYLGELMQVISVDADIKSFPNVKEYLIQKYNIKNMENFDNFFDKFGYAGVSYLNSDNIIELINLDTESYNKVINLFSEKNVKLNLNVINTLVNSFLQREFRLKCSDTYNIFSTFEELIRNPSEASTKKIISLLSKINTVVDAQSIVNMEMKTFVLGLIKHDPVAINALHNLTNAYIAKEREIYVSNNLESAMDRLYIEKYFNKSYLKKKYISDEPIETIEFTLTSSTRNPSINYTEEEKELLDERNHNLLLEIVKYKKDPKNNPLSPASNKYLKVFESILNKLYDARALNLQTIPTDAKYEYFIPNLDKERMLSILSNIKINHTVKKIISNDTLYSRLDKFIEKYKLLGWSNIFDRFASTTDMNLDETMPSALITYFDRIGALLPPNPSLTDVIDYANAYSGFSSKYPSLIKPDNFEYISANPGPNQAATPKSTRIEKIPYFVKSMYDRDSITIPSGELKIGVNGKNIDVSVGDIYDPIALTYGERTGACLRIGGAFQDLYSYCLSDKNGFHIRFTNPKTGSLISRVSGIRNGNTIFLNELRTSLDEEYSDEELAQVLKEIAKQLVLTTQDDPNPIENVIVSNDYAMSNQTIDDLMISNNNEAFKGINFNIHGLGHILYTSSKDHKTLMPYKFGDEYTSEYKPYNSAIHKASYREAKEAIERVIILNELLKGVPFEDINLPEVSELITDCVYGNGWVCYIDENGKFHEIIIDKFKEDKELKRLISNGINQYLGGATYEQANRKNS